MKMILRIGLIIFINTLLLAQSQLQSVNTIINDSAITQNEPIHKSVIDTNSERDKTKADTNNFFNLDSLASIAALIAAFIALFTLLEMKYQRKISMMPNLCVAPTIFNASFSDEDHIEWITVFDDSSVDGKKKQYKDNVNTKTSAKTHIRIDNIGLGTAKSINISWILDENFVKSFNFIARTYHNTIVKYGGGIFQYPKQSLPTVYAPKLNEYFQYLLPVSHEHIAIRIDIPEPYLFLYLRHLRLVFETEQIDKSKLPQFPTLRLAIKYDDIMNNHYKKIYSITPEGSAIGRPLANIKSLELSYKLNVEENT